MWSRVKNFVLSFFETTERHKIKSLERGFKRKFSENLRSLKDSMDFTHIGIKKLQEEDCGEVERAEFDGIRVRMQGAWRATDDPRAPLLDSRKAGMDVGYPKKYKYDFLERLDKITRRRKNDR